MQGADLAARDRLLRDTIVSLDPSLREAPMVVPAGSFCCFHYDMYHRRMRRLPARDSQVPPRIVFKFLFTSGSTTRSSRSCELQKRRTRRWLGRLRRS